MPKPDKSGRLLIPVLGTLVALAALLSDRALAQNPIKHGGVPVAPPPSGLTSPLGAAPVPSLPAVAPAAPALTPPAARVGAVPAAALNPEDRDLYRGTHVAQTRCIQCHAVMGETHSPVPKATPFSRLTPLEKGKLYTKLRRLDPDHPKMAPLTMSDLQGLIVYIKSLE
jgi:mono/diheme cytochrome c family protein